MQQKYRKKNKKPTKIQRGSGSSCVSIIMQPSKNLKLREKESKKKGNENMLWTHLNARPGVATFIYRSPQLLSFCWHGRWNVCLFVCTACIWTTTATPARTSWTASTASGLTAARITTTGATTATRTTTAATTLAIMNFYIYCNKKVKKKTEKSIWSIKI